MGSGQTGPFGFLQCHPVVAEHCFGQRPDLRCVRKRSNLYIRGQRFEGRQPDVANARVRNYGKVDQVRDDGESGSLSMRTAPADARIGWASVGVSPTDSPQPTG